MSLRESVFLLIPGEDQGSFLCPLSITHNAYHLFGGKLEDNESHKDALKREVAEEVGLELNDDDLSYLGCKFTAYGKTDWKETFFVLNRPVQPSVLTILEPSKISAVHSVTDDVLHSSAPVTGACATGLLMAYSRS